jgi:hypothetical protein
MCSKCWNKGLHDPVTIKFGIVLKSCTLIASLQQFLLYRKTGCGTWVVFCLYSSAERNCFEVI